MTDSNEVLTAAVNKLNNAVVELSQILRDDYPKRSEIESRFQSKLDSRKNVTRITVVALLTVFICYVTSTGAYSVCLVGEQNPSFCKLVPGYEDRIARRDQLDEQERLVNLRIDRLERRLKKASP